MSNVAPEPEVDDLHDLDRAVGTTNTTELTRALAGRNALRTTMFALAKQADYPVLRMGNTVVAPRGAHTYETIARVQPAPYIADVIAALQARLAKSEDANEDEQRDDENHLTSLRIDAADRRELEVGSGLSAHTLHLSQITSVDAKQARAFTGVWSAGRGYLIPYPELDADLLPVLQDDPYYGRVRLRSPIRLNASDDKTAKYIAPKGKPPRLYVPPIPPFTDGYLAGLGAEVWLTEGEKKSLRATQAGLPTMSVAGVWSWKSRGDDDLKTILPDIQRISWMDRRVVLVYDSDIRTGHAAWGAFLRLGRVLRQLGAADVHILTLPEEGGHDAA